MQRRQVLAAAGALLPIAGCLGSPGDGGSGDDSTTDPTDGTATTDGPTYEGADIEMVNAECATADAAGASVSFERDAVIVDGTIVGADACHVATLESVAYDEGARDLRIVVGTERHADEDTACAQCLTAIEYVVTARFAGGLPDRVVVAYRQGGSDETIAEASPD